jgi:hypothetical protein
MLSSAFPPTVVGSQGEGAIGMVMLGPLTPEILHGARNSVAAARP